MKNLENYGVLEMNAKEIKEIDGGFFPLVIWGVVVTAEVVATAFWVEVGAAVAQGQK